MSNANEDFLSELHINQLPSLPHVLVDLLHACQNADSSFQDLSAIIHRDTAIVARVIALANSPFYNRGMKINSVERALLVLGTDTIKTIVITAAVQQFFSNFSQTHASFLKRFWKRSLSCALLAKSLAILTSYPNPDEAYLGGLLHNIGELILNTNFDQRFGQLCADYPEEMERIDQESQAFPMNHCAIGAWLMKEWGLSALIADAIEFHHAPAAMLGDAHHLVKIVALSSLLSTDQALLEPDSFEIADQLFELNASLVSEITRKIQSEVIEVAQSMSIRIDDIHDNGDQQDQSKQIELAKQIRNISLLQTAKGELNRAESSTAALDTALSNTLALLFGLKRSAIFWYDAAENELSFVMPETGESHVPIKFRMEPHRSLIAQSAGDRKIACSLAPAFIPPHPVVDQQLSRFLQTSGLLCIPVFDERTLYCVIVAGVNADLSTQNALMQRLRYFSHEAAKSCRAVLSAASAKSDDSTAQTLIHQASIIAHEANNPLGIITNYLSTLANKLSDKTEVQDELRILREEVERTGAILHRLTDLRRVASNDTQGADINREISSLVTLYRSSLFLTHDTQCTLDLDPELKPHRISSHALRQILTNLIKNAVEAMPHGGALTLTTRHNVNVDGKDFVEILVHDHGPGIPDTVLRNLFKPVTSTKGDRHSGLGLSITRNLIKDAQGTIRCRSGSKGTEFQILFPSGKTGRETGEEQV